MGRTTCTKKLKQSLPLLLGILFVFRFSPFRSWPMKRYARSGAALKRPPGGDNTTLRNRDRLYIDILAFGLDRFA
jgi:hypothetical protein